MAPKSPWGKKLPQNAIPPASLPKTQPDTPARSIAKLDYEEIQNDELLALSSIYGDDFRRINTNQGAWKKAEPSFEIRVRSSDDDISIVLAVVFTATYPRSPPLLTIKGDKDLREGTRFKIQKVIETKPKELVSSEQAMIMEIVNACLDVLEDAAQAKADGLELPSLEEERAAHEEAANKLAKEQEQAEKRKQQMNSMEEERMLGTLVEDEMKRQKAKENETKRKSRLPGRFVPKASIENGTFKSQDEFLAFDHPVSFVDSRGDPCTFQVITSKVCIRRSLVSDCFTVRPVIYQVDAPTIALKQADLHSEAKDQNMFKKQLQALETDLKSLKELRHRNVLEFLDFKVQKTTDSDSSPGPSWTVSILTEFAEKGSLEEFLDVAGSLGVAKVRSWTIELLDALRFLHENGIVHEDIHTGNILLVRELNGEIRPKLADANFQRKLHDLKGGPQSKDTLSVAKSAYWLPPETANAKQVVYTQKTDVWQFGIVFLQMAFGLSVIKKYSSPSSLAGSLSLTDSFSEFIGKLFKADPKKRARTFELGSSEFLATDAEFLDIEASSPSLSRLGSVASLQLLTPRRPRHDSMSAYSGSLSRYKQDFVEEGRLGKGGFGEVVKARKKLDGQIYAIKKITQKSTESLTEVLKEVRLLSQLSHPSVVRYYNTWTEEIFDSNQIEDDMTSTDAATTEQSFSVRSPGDDIEIEFGNNTGGLDFMSSRGYPQIEFGFDDGSDEETEDDDDDSTSAGDNIDPIQGKNGNGLALKKSRSGSQYRRPFKIVLYISMEYCDKHTLRDLIRRGLHRNDNEMWRLLRQILEGLVHIHGLNVVHRDLKPENIFIDSASSVKIGDFGLATSGQYSVAERSISPATNIMNGEMTKSIGTAFYVAPEVSSSTGGGSYTSKVDMYSLGIILFEMCYKPLMPGMEKAKTSENLRLEPPTLPSDFDFAGKVAQASIIYALLARNPRDRPSSSELLQSGKLPMQMESETIRRALAGISDSESPYYQKMMTTLFSTPNKQAKDFAWDMDTSNPTSSDLLLQGLVKRNLVNIFRHHGAIETPRSVLFPRSRHYGSNVVQVLDPNGTLLQLPFDLTLPHARSLAKHEPPVLRSFAFGSVYRCKPSGAQPLTVEEVDFDIVSSDALDLALKEAEVIKVLDEIVISIPTLDSSYMCFHINHSDLLALIFDHCRIETVIREAVTETLSKLNIGPYSWQKIKTELRSPLIGASATSVDDLQKFDFRDTPNKAFQKLKALLEGTNTFDKASSVIAHLREVVDYTKRFQVRSKIYVSPLCSIKERFCKGGLVFSCLYGKKVKDVLAAGGRYDSLIKEHRHRIGTSFQQRHAVGFNLGLERLVKHPKSGHKGSKKLDDELNGIWNTKRCDVLVASHDPTILRTSAIDVVQILWNNDISAELAQDCRSPEDLLSKYRDEQHSWIITIREDSILYKVKSMDRKDAGDTDVPTSQLVPWLKNEIRERDNKEVNNNPRGKLLRHASQPEGPSGTEHEQEVRVLVAGTKSKKSNRRNIVEQAQTKAASLVQTFLDGPIAAIETTDQVLELIRDAKLSDPDSWRKLTHAVPMADRKYIGELHDLIEGMAKLNKDKTRNAFVYNFRTGTCIYYDLEA